MKERGRLEHFGNLVACHDEIVVGRRGGSIELAEISRTVGRGRTFPMPRVCGKPLWRIGIESAPVFEKHVVVAVREPRRPTVRIERRVEIDEIAQRKPSRYRSRF